MRTLAAGRPLDLLCCDANMHAAEVLSLVRPLLPLLRPGGLLVLTLKFCGRGRDKGRYREEVAAGLEAAAPSCGWAVELQWLLANTINERCVLARKGGSSGGCSNTSAAAKADGRGFASHTADCVKQD